MGVTEADLIVGVVGALLAAAVSYGVMRQRVEGLRERVSDNREYFKEQSSEQAEALKKLRSEFEAHERQGNEQWKEVAAQLAAIDKDIGERLTRIETLLEHQSNEP